MQFKLSILTTSLLFFTATLATPYGGDLAERTTHPIALKRWAEANRDNVNYEAFSNLPMDHRQALYSELSKDEQSALWVSHAEQFITANPELTDEQKAVVDKAVLLFKTPVEERTRESDKAFEEECKNALGFDKAAELLTTLGPAEDTSDTSSAKLAKRAPQCDCSSGDDWCGLWTCASGHDNCIQQPKKCGLGWDWDCDGRCI